MRGLSPVAASYGVVAGPSVECGVRLCTSAAWSSASGQRRTLSPLSEMAARAMRQSDLLVISETPFCRALWGLDVWWRVPASSHTSPHSELRYSVPLSVRIVHADDRPLACRKVETSAWKRLSISVDSFLLRMK